MFIKKIQVKNFKSFNDLKVELGEFNMLIGANASGKSNFIQIFQFIRDIVNFGLDNAISMQGGIDYLRNIKIGKSEDLLVNVVSDHKFKWTVRKSDKSLLGIKTYKIIYNFVLRPRRRGQRYETVIDKLKLFCNFVELKELKTKFKEIEKYGKGEISYYLENGKLKVDLKIPSKVMLDKNDILPSFLREVKYPSNTILFKTPFILTLPAFEMALSDISIYDFDPKLPKRATPITGKAEFEEDGSNLSIVLKNILKNRNKSRKLFNLISDLLPFVTKLDIEKFADKSLLFKIQEEYFGRQYLPASLISDGTINITALIVVLFFGKNQLTIIEEPERNIHPYLISRVVNMMKEASQKKQIIATTHNPEMVKHAGLKNILLISRDKDGFSTISRPADKKEVKIFLKNEIGIDRLYVKDLLGD